MKSLLNLLIIKYSLLTVCCSLFTVHCCFAQWIRNGERISYTKGNHHHPVISATKEAGSYITWVNSDSTSAGFYGNILLNALDAQGNTMSGFPYYGIQVTTIGNQWAPMVITSEDDRPILVWQGIKSINGLRLLFAQKFSKAGTPLWNGGEPVTICPTNNHQDQFPIVISDRHNGFYLSWDRYDSLNDTFTPFIWLQHIDSTGNVAKGWDPAGTAVANLNTYQYYPQLVLSNDESALYVMFSSGMIGASKLLLKKFNASNGTQISSNLFPVNGLVVSPGPNLYLNINYDQFIYCDKEDNVIILWSEIRYGMFNGEIYMQRISPTGEVMLTGGGKYIFGQNDGSGTAYMEASKDPDGNFLVTCNDYASGKNSIAALKIAENGKIIWQYVSTLGTLAYPKPITDGNKGMYLFYESFTDTLASLKAIALDSTGTLHKGWSPLGSDFGQINQNTLFGEQYDFTIASAEPARGIVTWNRIDKSQYNVYACNLKQDGTNCNFDPSSINELTNKNTIEVFPNPFTSDINIQLSDINSKFKIQNLKFKLYDITGKELMNKKLSSPYTLLTTPNLSNGIYFYNIIDNQTSIKRGKLIKQ